MVTRFIIAIELSFVKPAIKKQKENKNSPERLVKCSIRGIFFIYFHSLRLQPTM